MKSSSAVLGEEQMVDVELDRGTVFLPAQTGYTPVGSRLLWDVVTSSRGGKKNKSRADSSGPTGMCSSLDT